MLIAAQTLVAHSGNHERQPCRTKDTYQACAPPGNFYWPAAPATWTGL
jgi:hypothetical protein